MLARHVESKSNKATINFSSTTKIFLAENPKQEKNIVFFSKKEHFFLRTFAGQTQNAVLTKLSNLSWRKTVSFWLPKPKW